MIVGTAGHIDHGKTALIRALTGVETDRLKEEKARGISIDLGFAYSDLAESTTGFVDVPGHERFVHTMLAGAGGIDFALLVVAADDGVMPQTIEHVAILDLLGVHRGVVALSKADLAGPARRAEVAARVRTLLAGTGLGGAPVLEVSSRTGEGIDALRTLLAEAERSTRARAATGLARMPVDRVFTLDGVGTIVTGTVISGSFAIGDRVMVSPSGRPARIRGIHAQNRPVERGAAGQRCALNLSGEGISKDAIHRGDVILDPALHAPSDRIDARTRLLATEAGPLRAHLPVRLHVNSSEAGARLLPLGDPARPGGDGFVQLVLDRPLAVAIGDRFILRDVSARRTIGGGVLLDPRPPARKRQTPERLALLAAACAPDPLRRMLEVPPRMVDIAVFARDRAIPVPALPDGAKMFDGMVLSADGLKALRSGLAMELADFHAAQPEMQGMGRERLRLSLSPRLPKAAFLAFLREEAAAGRLVIDGAFLRLPGHEARLGPEEEALYERIAPLLGAAARFRPPRVRDLATGLGEDEREVRRLLKLCARMGRVDQIAHDHFFLRATTVEMVGLAREVSGAAPDGWFPAALFRDRMDNGRKVAIQILDFFDRDGVTLRRGDLRRINPHRLDLYGEPAQGGESSPVGRPDFKSGWGSEPVPGGFDSHSLPPNSR